MNEFRDVAGAVPVPAAFEIWCAAEDQDIAVELVTCGADGWPHVAHLSTGELVVDAGGNIRLALWKVSRGAKNLSESGHACLLLTMPGAVLELRLAVLAEAMLPGHAALHAFHLSLLAVRDKSAPYAEIISGVRFRLKDPDETYARWRRVQQDLLAL